MWRSSMHACSSCSSRYLKNVAKLNACTFIIFIKVLAENHRQKVMYLCKFFNTYIILNQTLLTNRHANVVSPHQSANLQKASDSQDHQHELKTSQLRNWTTITTQTILLNINIIPQRPSCQEKLRSADRTPNFKTNVALSGRKH